MTDQVRRSWLIVPAHDEDALTEAADSLADAVVLDLQDTVHDSRKHHAREHIRDSIKQMRTRGSEVFVRVDCELMYADLVASVWPGLSGVMLPGVTRVGQVKEADQLLGQLEAERGVMRPPPIGEIREADDPRGPEQALEIHLCLDTARSNWDGVDLIQASDRVTTISLGRADLVMDLRGEPTGDLHLLPYLMQRLIVIAGATKVQAIGAWWRGNSRGLVASYQDTLEAATTGMQTGFRGALCMRTHQVAALNSGFTPSVSEVSHATAIVHALAQAKSQGNPSVVTDGEIVGVARAEIAGKTINWSEACHSRDKSKLKLIPS